MTSEIKDGRRTPAANNHHFALLFYYFQHRYSPFSQGFTKIFTETFRELDDEHIS